MLAALVAQAGVLARGAVLEVELEVVLGLAADDDHVLGEAELLRGCPSRSTAI